MSTDFNRKKLPATQDESGKGGLNKNPSNAGPDKVFNRDKKVYEIRCRKIFKAWEKDRKDDKKIRMMYAKGITILVFLQVAFVYKLVVDRLYYPEGLPSTTQTAEFIGIIGAILAQSFGVFYLVVKYFFGKRPEDLEKISSFFLNCHPSQFGSQYRDKWENNNAGERTKA